MTTLELILSGVVAYLWILGGVSSHLMVCSLGDAVRHKNVLTKVGQYTVYAVWPFVLLWVVVTVNHGPRRSG